MIYRIAADGLRAAPALCGWLQRHIRDQSLHFDNSHLTNYGTILLRDLFQPFLTSQNLAGHL